MATAKRDYNVNRAEVVDRNFVAFVRAWDLSHGKSEKNKKPGDPIIPGDALTCRDAVELFESQVLTRHIDLEARKMRTRGEGFHTIGSTGHEGNAVIGRLARHTDPAFLHYRSGALMLERARKVSGIDIVRDTMLSIAASSQDPTSGGRHKVWGSAPLWVPPQTSTIASHLPKAVGAAYFLRRATKSRSDGAMEYRSDGPNTPLLQCSNTPPSDSIILCTFGDATVNHAAAQTAFNAACWTAHQGLPMPILFVCEDNGIGISVSTPPGWIEAGMGARPSLKYFRANGLDLLETHCVATKAVDHCRIHRAPVFLHLKMVRLLGHAGTDAERGYRTWEEIEAIEAEDPLLHSARTLMAEGVLGSGQILEMYESSRGRVQKAARKAAKAPKLGSAKEVMAPLAPYHRDKVAAEASRVTAPEVRHKVFGSDKSLPEQTGPKHMAALIDLGLHDIMAKYPESVLFGEDVGKKGGVYNVTNGLQAKFGVGRVFDTLLDETMILGMGIGAGILGLLPLPEIQYLAYYHNSEDQIRGEACSLQFFSNGQFRNPMVVRAQGWSYQKGFGGHFHNDNSIAAMRDVPGLVIATPSRGDDAVKMMRTLLALAKVDGRVCIMIEPIALYMTRDLHDPKDGLWQFPYPSPDESIPLGEGAVYDEDAKDLTILTFANGLYMSMRAAKTLADNRGVRARVVDLRWLNPLNEDFIVAQAEATGRVLVVDESRRTGGIAEAVLAIIHERCSGVTAARINAFDTYVPLGPAADTVLPGERDIISAATEIVGRNHGPDRGIRKWRSEGR